MRQWEDYSEEALMMAKLGIEHNDPKYFIKLTETRTDSIVANMTIVLIRQAISLTTKYLDRVCDNFSKEGGFREQMTAIRLKSRG
jgi:four helix bundle suffix protein